MSAALKHHASLNVAKLPGVGEVENPEPKHYAMAIRYLTEDIRSQPQPRRKHSNLVDPRQAQIDALCNTLCKIMFCRSMRGDAPCPR